MRNFPFLIPMAAIVAVVTYAVLSTANPLAQLGAALQGIAR